MNISALTNIFLHLDKYLNILLTNYNIWAYVVLFAAIFIETGLVVTPFLPGDSLIFVTGAIAAAGGPISIPLVLFLFYVAAIAGDTVNYQIGRLFQGRVRRREHIRFIKMEYIDRTHAFFKRHGGKTITIARFIPIIRTFAPFVAGVGEMPYRWFLGYNIIGGLSWVSLMFAIGYFFGNIGYVKNHFSLVTIAIIIISVLPVVVSLVKNRIHKSNDNSKRENAQTR